MKKAHSWFQDLSKSGKIIVLSILTVLALGTAGSFAQQGTPTQPAPSANTPIPATSTPSPVKETKTITTTEVIPFTSSTIEDASLDQGIKQTSIQGVNGERTHYFEVTYINGTETSRKEVKNEITKTPVDEVVRTGTRAPAPSCPNGTYVNTYGNTVCSPYSSSSIPAGASAQCVDGSYSFSQSRRGTCSHHGGVAVWY